MKPSILVLAAALALSAPAFAQPPVAGAAAAQTYEGRTVRDAKGVVLGQIDKVVLGPNGRPAQVLVRPAGRPTAGVRSLAVAGLAPDAEGFSTPLTKAEFEAMPTVELDQS